MEILCGFRDLRVKICASTLVAGLWVRLSAGILMHHEPKLQFLDGLTEAVIWLRYALSKITGDALER